MNSKQPFASFGEALKKLREQTSESQIEVSGAVEIDITSLESYEIGETRPTEDILILLIQHFDLEGDEASELWRLAGYGAMSHDQSQYFMNDDFGGTKSTQTVLVGPEDARVVYTDMVQVMVNNYGVIINFMQGAGTGNSPLAVSRIGMSKEHAKSIIDVLTTTLDQAHTLEQEQKSKSPKHLPSGQTERDKKQKD